MGSSLGHISGIARTTGVSSLGNIAGSLLSIGLGEWRFLLKLTFEVVFGHVRHIMPCVVVCRTVYLVELMLVRLDLETDVSRVLH